jgi:hypothetical protein
LAFVVFVPIGVPPPSECRRLNASRQAKANASIQA